MAPSLYDSDNNDDDDSSSHGQADVSESEKFYVSKGNDKRILICLCIGLKGADGQPLINPDKDPWAKQAADVRKPNMAEHLKPEILCRSSSFVTFGSKSAPRPGQWNLEKCMEWLHAYPIIDLDCKEFLRLEALRVTKILKDAVQEKDTEALAIRFGVWAGPKPYLRLVHCIIDDSIRPHYLRRDAVLSRAQLDSRNSDSRPPTAYERIAAKWNDPTFNPSTAVSDCHHDFSAPIEIGHESVKHLRPAVAGDIKDRLTDIRARLIRMIKKWERSGQGDGGRDNYNEEDRSSNNNDEEDRSSAGVEIDPDKLTSGALGKLESRSQFAMDSRQNFLSDGKHGKLNPWYLYFWELADKYELLASTVTELSAGVGAVDANAVPAAITTGGYDSSASKRKRTPRRRRRGSRKKDDDSASSGGSSGTRKKNADAELTSAIATLGNETKMSVLDSISVLCARTQDPSIVGLQN